MNVIDRLFRKQHKNEEIQVEEVPAKSGVVIKKNDHVEFLADLIDLIQLKNVRMHEVLGESEPCFFIRHDVDHDLDFALHIAEAEASRGYRATYFLLPPGSYEKVDNYYGTLENNTIVHAPDLLDKCRRLVDLGHDLGLHNDMVSMALTARKNPADLIAREVDYFDRHQLTLKGTASHGNPLARELQYNNRELFQSCIRKGWVPGRTICYNDWQVTLHSLKLEEFGFQYEAYSLPRDSRISESGGKWGGKILGYQIDRQKMFEQFDLDEFRGIISRLTPDSGVKTMQVMTHPCHWTLGE